MSITQPLKNFFFYELCSKCHFIVFWFVSSDENSAVIFFFVLCNFGCLQIFFYTAFILFLGLTFIVLHLSIVLYLLNILFDFSLLYFGLDNFYWHIFKFTVFFFCLFLLFIFIAVSSMLINMSKEFSVSDTVLLKFTAFLFYSYFIVSIALWKFSHLFLYIVHLF